MKTKIEWDQDILLITNTIRHKYPDLSKYFMAKPTKDLEDNEANNKSLEDYYESLKWLLTIYSKEIKVSYLPKNIVRPLFQKTKPVSSSDEKSNQQVIEKDINLEHNLENTALKNGNGIVKEKGFDKDKSGDDSEV